MFVHAVSPSGLHEAIDRTVGRFQRAGASRSQYYYVRNKLKTDPSAAAIAQLAPLGDVLDLGCGRGQLAILLLERGAATRVDGVDWDRSKVDLAVRAAVGLPARFVAGDVRTAEVRAADSVLLIDVLHYFDRDTQNALLARAADLVRPGGRLILRDADTRRGWRSIVTNVQERVMTAVRFNRGERVLFRDIAGDLVPRLEARGLTCTVSACWGATPFSNMLLVARRR